MTNPCLHFGLRLSRIILVFLFPEPSETLQNELMVFPTSEGISLLAWTMTMWTMPKGSEGLVEFDIRLLKGMDAFIDDVPKVSVKKSNF